MGECPEMHPVFKPAARRQLDAEFTGSDAHVESVIEPAPQLDNERIVATVELHLPARFHGRYDASFRESGRAKPGMPDAIAAAEPLRFHGCAQFRRGFL